MAKDVLCHVESCAYNQNCKCDATEIKVGNCRCKEAKNIQETACETFKSK